MYWNYHAQDVSPWFFFPPAWFFTQTLVHYDLSIKFNDDYTVLEFYYHNGKRE